MAVAQRAAMSRSLISTLVTGVFIAVLLTHCSEEIAQCETPDCQGHAPGGGGSAAPGGGGAGGGAVASGGGASLGGGSASGGTEASGGGDGTGGGGTLVSGGGGGTQGTGGSAAVGGGGAALTSGTYTLGYSTSSSTGPFTGLEGATIHQDVWIHMTVTAAASSMIDHVEWTVDATLFRNDDQLAPYDLTYVPASYPMTSWGGNGPHSVTAKIVYVGAQPADTVVAHLTVSGSTGAGGGSAGAGGGGAAMGGGTPASGGGTGTGGGSVVSGCPDDDGSSGASAGPPQYPNLLSGYTRTAHELGCQIAGVDYHVGVPSNQTLADPTMGGLPAGCSYDGNGSVSCSITGSATIQGFDFSLHSGIRLYLTGHRTGTITITRNNFAAAPRCLDPSILDQGSGGAVIITYNTIDGGGATCMSPVFGGVVQAGDVIKWNWIKNSPEDILRSGSDIRFNLMDTQGWTGHPDGIQYVGWNGSPVISHNTYRNPNVGQGASGGCQPLHVEAQLTSAITNAVVSYNTVITPGNGGGQTANYDIACKQDGAGNTNTGFKAFGNYVDPTGAWGPTIDAYGCTGTTWGSPSANVNMVTGTNL
jgi:hypothetical protein